MMCLRLHNAHDNSEVFDGGCDQVAKDDRPNELEVMWGTVELLIGRIGEGMMGIEGESGEVVSDEVEVEGSLKWVLELRQD